MEVKVLQRNILQRIFGICATKKPADGGCWTFSDGKVAIDLSRAPELNEPWGAIRLEKKNLPERVLVTKAEDGAFHAFRSKCTHAGRRLDPVPGTATVQCCSVGRSTFDYEGKVLAGSAKAPIVVHKTRIDNGKLIVELSA